MRPRDELGFLTDEKCPHCGAAMYLSEEDEAKGKKPICLNGCRLPGYLYARLRNIGSMAKIVRREESGDV